MNSLRDKTAIITGAASGIGRAIALRCAEEGARLVLGDIDVQAGEAFVASLHRREVACTFVRTDVSKYDDCEQLVQTAIGRYGGLDIAFNNAGISDGPTPPGTVKYPLELWDRLIAVNLTGVFYGMRAQIPAMLERGGGAIVNTASIAGVVAFASVPGYVATKHGVVGLTKCIALEYGAKGIRCNAIAPGIIETPMTKDVLAIAELRQLTTGPIPMKRTGTALEVAELAVWLASDRASYVNGSTVAVDGGYLAS